MAKERYYWYDQDTERFMKSGYLSSGETIDDRVTAICDYAADLHSDIFDEDSTDSSNEFHQSLYDAISLGRISLSSPIWSNFGHNQKGLPISCNGLVVQDSMEDILRAMSTIGMQTKHGAGTSAYIGHLRPRGALIGNYGESTGPAHLSQLFDVVTNVVSQGNTRRGSCAVYVDIEHDDIMDFCRWRTEGNEIQKLSWGVCVSDSFMQRFVDKTDTEKDREIWQKVIRSRMRTGYPYIFFTDTVNSPENTQFSVPVYGSNLCSEIILPDNFSCCLASVNVASLNSPLVPDETVRTLVDFLSLVNHDYSNRILSNPQKYPHMQEHGREARELNAIGIGILGYHDYLQRHSHVFARSERISKEMMRSIFIAAARRSNELLKYGPSARKRSNGKALCDRYNATLTAIAPTTSSSFILGKASPSVEPLMSNYFIKDLAKGKFTYKNENLRKVLVNYGKDTEEVWDSILENSGSVQHLDFLDDHELQVYKTFPEIEQSSIINVAAARTKYLDQSQSLNLIYTSEPGKVPDPKPILKDIFHAWRSGLKTLYYHRSTSPTQDMVNKMKRISKIKNEPEECQVCSL